MARYFLRKIPVFSVDEHVPSEEYPNYGGGTRVEPVPAREAVDDFFDGLIAITIAESYSLIYNGNIYAHGDFTGMWQTIDFGGY